MVRPLLPLLFLAAQLFGASAALGQYTRDASALKKIDEAINQHYLVTNFDRAEGILTGTVKACEDKCSPGTLARAWMYVGIIRGSGRNDLAGAREAFQTALSLEPRVALDAALATPETKAAFDQLSAGGAVAREAGPPQAAQPAQSESTGGGLPTGVNMSCTPQVTEIETRRPIPVQCTSPEELTQAELRYQSFGSDKWLTLTMEKMGESFGATVPCEATSPAGTFSIYVRGRNAAGQDIANWGSQGDPVQFQLVAGSDAEPPSFSGAEPPDRCAAPEICPPDFPGCEADKKPSGSVEWGGSCSQSAECKSGLLCIQGTCETAPNCSSDSDCPVGACEDGTCRIDRASEEETTSTGPRKWRIGIHLAQDIPSIGGTDVCLDENQLESNWACYWSSTQDEAPYQSATFGNVGPGGGGTIGSGFAFGTRRLLLSLDYALTANLTAGLRVGYAFGGGPPAGKYVQYERQGENTNRYGRVVEEGTDFLPFHFELRAAYFFGQEPLNELGLHPYVHVGGGAAQVDARAVAKVRDDFKVGPPTPDDEIGEIDAWKKLGQGFVTIGGGASYAISSTLSLQLNLNAMLLFSASGLNLQPSFGVTYAVF